MYLIGCDTDAVCAVRVCVFVFDRANEGVEVLGHGRFSFARRPGIPIPAAFSIWYFHSHCSHVHSATV